MRRGQFSINKKMMNESKSSKLYNMKYCVYNMVIRKQYKTQFSKQL